MKVLLSAYACDPGAGSEPGVGFGTLSAVAAHHDVWVLTQPHMATALAETLADHPDGSRIRVEAVPPDAGAQGPGLRGLAAVHRRHDLWQRRAARRAVELDRDVDFDVVHHVTLAAYWMRTGVAALDKPLVWGPVGGGVEPPLRLLCELGVNGLLQDAVRWAFRHAAAVVTVPRVRRRQPVTFVQNADTARRLPRFSDVSVLCNALAAVPSAVCAAAPARRTREIVFAGRLSPWKAARFAVRVLRHVRTPGVVLRMFGAGQDRARVVRSARRWGLEDRIRLEGMRPRDEVLRHVATAGVLLHPALHEEGGMVVAEALALGTPVVCLRRGGPDALRLQWPDTPSAAVDPAWPETAARACAAAVDRMLSRPPAVRTQALPPRQTYASSILEAYERAVRLSTVTSTGPEEGTP